MITKRGRHRSSTNLEIRQIHNYHLQLSNVLSLTDEEIQVSPITHDKPCQILGFLLPEGVAMVYMSAVHQYWPFSSFWVYGEIAHSLPFGVKCGHVTYFGQWNLSIPDMCKFWAEGGKSQGWFSTSAFSLSLQPVMFQMVGPRSCWGQRGTEVPSPKQTHRLAGDI